MKDHGPTDHEIDAAQARLERLFGFEPDPPMIDPDRRQELAKDLAERDRKFWLNVRREKKIEARNDKLATHRNRP